MNKNVVYSVIIGEYDHLVDPNIITPGWDYVCFTDTDKKSDVWKICKVETDPNLSNRKLSRKIQILYHHYLANYETTIVIPGYSLININLDNVVESFGEFYDVVLLNHPRRKCIYDESEYFIQCTGDPGGQIKQQMQYYKDQGMPAKLGLAACGLIIRKVQNKNVQKHCELWWEEVLKYSNNDQISFMYIYWKYNLINFKKWGFRYFDRYFRCGRHHVGEKEYIMKHAAD